MINLNVLKKSKSYDNLISSNVLINNKKNIQLSKSFDSLNNLNYFKNNLFYKSKKIPIYILKKRVREKTYYSNSPTINDAKNIINQCNSVISNFS